MKKLIVFVIVLCVSTSVWAQEELPVEQWYQFWVGNWDLTWQDAGGGTGKGTNQIVRILDGKVIQENFKALEGALAGYSGMSLSVYNPTAKQWKQAWTDSQGGYFDFTGRKDEDRFYFETAETDNGQGGVQQRMVFYEITEEAFTWDWESTQDGGATWTLNWRIQYRRQQ
ncbi:MAG TPA: hypothetical protein DCE41_21560 [Cytophagales bacterium]|nr:hypothetical protein [Cytophagales bacterium]HAA18329.1 hypothetical protein [Cytophagales bacterium]HAP59581.1 hypothetical protein [Cytophagales bacterium]